MYGLYQDLIAIQRDLYLALADRIRDYASTGDCSVLATFVPIGILFGAVHALTPGHSKILLATYLTGTRHNLIRGFGVSLALAFTHVGMSVIIALLGLKLVSATLGSYGEAPILEGLSRILIGAIGVWMIYRAIWRGHYDRRHDDGLAFGFTAGLVPCPLTLAFMTFAIVRGVPEAGIAFAAVMMVGVVLVLGVVALTAVLFRQRLFALLSSWPRLVDRLTRVLQIVVGIVLITVAVNAMRG